MNIRLATMSTIPKQSTNYWQCVFFPTLSAYYACYDGENKHLAVNAEWLFWSMTLLIYTNDKGPVYIP